MTVNGYTNGHTNGHANGHANGHVNGNGVNGVNGAANGHTNGNGVATPIKVSTSNKSRLSPVDPEAVQDLICVGFGPASLSVAVALHDALESGSLQIPPKVLFLEKQQRFAWHAGMLLPGAKMQISFVKDLATLRNPRSAFTFINYLHRNGRLVEFTNLGTFLPARTEYEDYLRWCASTFDDSVVYGSEVVLVEADKEAQEAGSPLTTFRVTVQNAKTGVQQTYRARNVLMATGGKPRLPPSMPAAHPRVIHSSQYAHLVPTILTNPSAAYRVAVVGAGQSAAEIFNNIQVLYPNSKTSLIMRSEFLRPSDDSPFVNSIFNPEYVDNLYPKPASYRKNILDEARPTNYGVVRLELIEALYERMYHQRRVLGTDESQWPHRILGGHHVVSVTPDAEDRLRVVVEPELEDLSKVQELDVDLIICATGYQRNAHLTMLKGLWPLLPETPVGKAADDAQVGIGSWTVDEKSPKVLSVSRDYHVGFAPGQVANGSGVYLQGCCEGTHGLSDTLLSVLATRSGEIVESIFGASA